MTTMLISVLAFYTLCVRLCDASSDSSSSKNLELVDSDFYRMKDRCTSIAVGKEL
jgi:hypothetical protein